MFLRLTTSSAALALLMAPPAFSLTADEVWQTWEESLTINGHDVTIGEREDAGDALILRDVELSIFSRSSALTELILPHLGFLPVNGLQADLPDSDDAMMEIIFPRIELTPTGGDAVRIGLPEEIGFALTGQFSLNPDLDIEVAGTIDANQIETIASDEGDKQRWVTNGSEARLAIDHFTLEENVFDGNIATITVTGIKSDLLFGGPGQVKQDSSVAGINLTLAMANDEADVNIKGRIDGLEMAGGYDYPEGQKADDSIAMSAALAAGGKANGKLAIGPVDISLDIQVGDTDSGQASMDGKITSQSTDFTFDMTKEGLHYQTGGTDLNFDINSRDLFPSMNIALDALRLDLLTPLLSSEDAQPFSLSYALENMTLSDETWMMTGMDKHRNFAQGPIIVDMDIAGNVILEEDLLPLFDQLDAYPDALDDLQLKLSDLTINKLALRAVGVAIDADGVVRFPDPDNMDIADGKLSATYSGVNALLENLTQAGLIPEDQITGIRMGMMMFARPVEGKEDTLATELEFKEDGSIFVNDMRIQ